MNGAEDCSKKLKDLGGFVTIVSVFAICVGLLMSRNPAAAGLGRFMYVTSWVWISFGGWGVITGIGILRKWRWARISMLVFCGILVFIGGFMFLVMLVLPSRDPNGWTRELIFGKALIVAITFIPPFVGFRWCIYFTRKSVKAYFHGGSIPAQP
jgi:hypothetical protein